jgi:hypothetical protein
VLCYGEMQADADQAAAIKRLSALRSSLVEYTASMGAYRVALATHRVTHGQNPHVLAERWLPLDWAGVALEWVRHGRLTGVGAGSQAERVQLLLKLEAADTERAAAQASASTAASSDGGGEFVRGLRSALMGGNSSEPANGKERAGGAERAAERAAAARREAEADRRLPPPLAPTPPRGLFLHGSVGTGKSMLMDMFFQSCDGLVRVVWSAEA